MEARPRGWPLQLADVPAPDLVRAGREQLRPRVGRMGQLVAALPHPAVAGGEQPVHRPFRGQVAALIEQRGVDLRRASSRRTARSAAARAPAALELAERPRRWAPRPPLDQPRWPAAAVERRARDAQRAACRCCPQQRLDLSDGLRRSCAARCCRPRPWPADPPRARRRFPGSRSPGGPSADQPRCAPADDEPRPARPAPGSAWPGRAASARAPPAHPTRVHGATPSTASCTAPHDASSSPTSPDREHASASRTIRSLYSAENRRRFGRSTSSGSGTPTRSPPADSALVAYGSLRRPARANRHLQPVQLQHHCDSDLALGLVGKQTATTVSPQLGREGAAHFLRPHPARPRRRRCRRRRAAGTAFQKCGRARSSLPASRCSNALRRRESYARTRTSPTSHGWSSGSLRFLPATRNRSSESSTSPSTAFATSRPKGEQWNRSSGGWRRPVTGETELRRRRRRWERPPRYRRFETSVSMLEGEAGAVGGDDSVVGAVGCSLPGLALIHRWVGGLRPVCVEE